MTSVNYMGRIIRVTMALPGDGIVYTTMWPIYNHNSSHPFFNEILAERKLSMEVVLRDKDVIDESLPVSLETFRGAITFYFGLRCVTVYLSHLNLFYIPWSQHPQKGSIISCCKGAKKINITWNAL